ncbi:MAG: hypothetical protein HOP29_10035 [Phycisphaerales bacterium]|nr:hypothetical protein [Phycisphaerales bacterium]
MQSQNEDYSKTKHGDDVADEMKRQIGFNADDAARLASLNPLVAPHIAGIVRRFYDHILQQPGMRRILTRDDVNLTGLHALFADWLSDLFRGDYGPAYFEKRSRIGRRHVVVGLPQHYMVTAVEIMRREIERVVLGADPPDCNAKLQSLYRLLTLELGIMLESYKRRYAALVQENERALVEARLTRAERLAEIGQLAASLAHEIKNPLAGISGAIQIIRDDLGPHHVHREIIGEILGQINRLDAVVKDLLVYARPSPARLALCDLNDLVRRVLSAMREESTMKRARITFQPAKDAPPIHADESKMEQLILNLLLNAAQAVHDGGRIQVSTESDGDRIRLVVHDDGCGMTDEVRRRAFEPFFTTKARGTGLGLPMCKTIVDDHGGRITLNGETGTGVRVIVDLPAGNATTSLPLGA